VLPTIVEALFQLSNSPTCIGPGFAFRASPGQARVIDPQICATEADLRLRSARDGFVGLLHVPGRVTCADAPRFVRAVARTRTWAVWAAPAERQLIAIDLVDLRESEIGESGACTAN
jgi:hypothetical protein